MLLLVVPHACNMYGYFSGPKEVEEKEDVRRTKKKKKERRKSTYSRRCWLFCLPAPDGHTHPSNVRTVTLTRKMMYVVTFRRVLVLFCPHH